MNLQIQRSAAVISYFNLLSLCGLSSPCDDFSLIPPSLTPIYSSKSLKFCNYGRIPYIFSFCCQSPQSKHLNQAFHLMLPIQTNLSRLHQPKNKHILNCTSPWVWPILSQFWKSYRLQDINCKLPLKIFRKEISFKWNLQFQIQPSISGVNFSNNISIPHITWHNLWKSITGKSIFWNSFPLVRYDP